MYLVMSRRGLFILLVFFLIVLSLTKNNVNSSSISTDQHTGFKRSFSFTWHESFGTNVSLETPSMFINVSHAILSARQHQFDDMTFYSLRYGSGFSLTKHENKNITEIYPENCFMVPLSIATYCDWALLVPCLYGNISRLPRTIFVHHLMLPHFISSILPKIPFYHKFVLVSSGTDQTIPRSSGDIRFQPLYGFSNTTSGGSNWRLLTNHPQVIHWFCENHDLSHRKVATLPTGVVEDVVGMSHIYNTTINIPLEDRTIQYLVIHRTRTGTGQWALRMQITLLCMKEYSDYNNKTHFLTHNHLYNSHLQHNITHIANNKPLCLLPNINIHHDKRGGVSQYMFINLIQSVSFVLCVHGGGLDPSPKAWESLMLGTIPIIEYNTLYDAYKQFPVVFIKNWTELFIDNKEFVRKRLEILRLKLAPFYSNPILRAQVVERLKMSFWVDQIYTTYRQRRHSPSTVNIALTF